MNLSRQIIVNTAAKHGYRPYQMKESSRNRGRGNMKPHSIAKQEIMYRLRMERGLSYGTIARMLDLDCHTTVMHGIKRHAERVM